MDPLIKVFTGALSKNFDNVTLPKEMGQYENLTIVLKNMV